MPYRLLADIREALPMLPQGHYATIYADPPWAETGGGAVYKRGCDRHYGILRQKDLLELPVGALALPNAHLYLWVTNNFLEDGLELVTRWGFTYKTLITWAKDRFGIGQYFRGQTEHCIFAVRGCLPYKSIDMGGGLFKRGQGTTLISAPRLEHSAKPEQMREYIERVSYGPKVELFGRKVPLDWDAIGNQLQEPTWTSPDLEPVVDELVPDTELELAA